MDTEVTLNINENVFYAAEEFANRRGISINKLTEFLWKKLAASEYKSIEDLPVAEWVLQLGEGPVEAEPNPKSWKEMKEEYYENKK